VRFVADSSAKAACGAGGVRSIPPDPGLLSLGEYPGAPAARLHTYGTYLIALFSCEGLFSARENAPFEKMRFGWPKT